MVRALDLAWRGWGRVQPNPMVGAVVLSSDGRFVGEGWHAEFGERHAEPIALEAAGERARGATLVVTLEPCTHHGKQPPCTDAVLAAGVRRVVVAMPDPNPRGERRRRKARRRWRGGPDRARAGGGRGPERDLPASLPRGGQTLRRAQARHQPRRTHRGRRRAVAMDLGRQGAGVRALASRGLRRDRRGRADRAPGRSPAHRARGPWSRESRHGASSSTPRPS